MASLPLTAQSSVLRNAKEVADCLSLRGRCPGKLLITASALPTTSQASQGAVDSVSNAAARQVWSRDQLVRVLFAWSRDWLWRSGWSCLSEHVQANFG
jgi:hypothetical protein